MSLGSMISTFAALGAQLAGNVFGNLLHARHILAAGLDMHQIAQRIQVGLLLLFACSSHSA